ncbi:hypothetical protein LWC35_14325 [Pseudonocardia kujensis]|uniref:CoA-transferase n=1 Tax=Pseudonocardia kujensis TaxID=1128675 RepID=UPI001E3B8999|nr:CoA-transferase [Pseudonocardia kujensis]MCE0764077.1 hypothetical protein [Pseudonocardia kujensis]
MTVAFCSADEAAAAIPEGATIAVDGFCMVGVAEAFLQALEERFLNTGSPRNLTLVHAMGPTDGVHGLEHFAHPGLLRRVVGAHWGLAPRMAALLTSGSVDVFCLPQGQLSELYRTTAAGRPGHVSPVGLDTFVDPKLQGGRITTVPGSTAPALVERVHLAGADHLFYRSIPIDVAIIRATSIDDDGNCSNEEEPLHLDALAVAQAAHNSGGTVIVQAKRRVPRGTLRPKEVVIPGVLVDRVVLAEDPAQSHRQTARTVFDPRLLASPAEIAREGLVQEPVHATVVPGDRERIGQRALRMLRRGDIANIGAGLPLDTIAAALHDARTGQGGVGPADNAIDGVVLTIESGVYGGTPSAGADVGTAVGADAIIPHVAQFRFYDGGGLDIAFLGAGQVDLEGNVNVSLLGGRLIGVGGFVDIVHGARRICFCLTIRSRHPKFVERVDHVSFSARNALAAGKQVNYVTEDAILELTPRGLALVEVAPGCDVAALTAQFPGPVDVSRCRKVEP